MTSYINHVVQYNMAAWHVMKAKVSYSVVHVTFELTEKLTSMPFTVYGHSMKFLPLKTHIR